MAKKAGARDFVAMECPQCKNRNYYTPKRTKGTVPKLELKKYCRHCQQHTKHNEKKK